MESQFFQIIKLQNQNVVSRFNHFRRFARLIQICEALAVLAAIFWSSAAVFSAAGRFLVQCSTYLFNYHVVFLIGNTIIVLLVVICRRNDDGDDLFDFYGEYLKHSEIAVQSTLQPPIQTPESENGEEKEITQCDDVLCRGNDRVEIYEDYLKQSETAVRSNLPPAVESGEEKRILQFDNVPEAIDVLSRHNDEGDDRNDFYGEIAVRSALPPTIQSPAYEEEKQIVVCEAVPQCENVLEKKKFKRAKSEKLKREIPVAEVRRSSSRSGREMEYSGDVDIENLSSEEFRRRVDAFIDKHWNKRNQIDEHEKHRFLVMA